MVICQFAAVLPKYSPICQNRQFTAAELANLPTVAISLVDHSCEGRNLIAMGGIAALVTPPLAANEREIPAFAGMVYLGTGIVVGFGDCAYTTL